MGPTKPGTVQELDDFAQVKNQEAVALCYTLGLVEPENEGEKFFLKPQAPADQETRKAMAEKAAALAGKKTDFVPAGPTVDEACAQLAEALLSGAEGLPKVKLIDKTQTMEKLTIADGELYMAVPGKDLTMTVSGVGTNMKPGTYENVTLTVSLGTQYVTVPDLTNYVQADAEQQLKELGVSVLVTQAVDTSVASGAVIRTDPAAGSQVAAGSTVVMYISRPQVATTTKVPSLTGMSTADARTLLVQNHLGLGSQTEQYSDQPVGTVISQNPAAGSTTKLNGRVNIVVSAGPEPAPEPEAPSDSTTGGDWWSGLFGSSSSSSSTETGTEQGTAGSGEPSQKPLTDWWSSLLS